MGEIYGKLYNGHAVLDKRGLAPTGWHVATDEEWTNLTNYLGVHQAAKKLKAMKGWTFGSDSNGSNESGFAALPGGMMMYTGQFYYEGQYANFWTSTVIADAKVRTHYHRMIDYSNYLDLQREGQNSGTGNSVRCVKD